ncbi:hypothetical protein GCM10011391_30360 [Pullulanibacillus camelliae]|uniref:Capsule synthesis protein CapA domain-containing protein n=1 Tax=Pullulanibacillus camelliae TaxID=1707096 RepID=A0A8J3DY95_9BACL|nr:CapA family protein [Pullulanibacillus camelliae]GGE49472.1 hypothetical protein GCM10011391_30360 [Pullulanibacillus camelliae]
MKSKWKIIYILMTAAIACMLVILFIWQSPSPKTIPLQTLPHDIKPPSAYSSSATLAAVGDVLIHSQVYDQAKTKNGYDFKPMFEKVKPVIQSADIAVANQESMMGGEALGLSTYPAFNSPFEIGDALKDAGFNVVTMANNHTLDHGEKAIKNAIHYWDKIHMVHTGSFLSKKDQNTLCIVKKNNIKFAFLAYTYGTNGIPTPEHKDYLVNRINIPQMKKDIAKAKKSADVIVVALHFGIEYQTMPNTEQKQLVKTLADSGVDIIIGNHPHVLQPVQWVHGKGSHKTFVVYSLGNFISGQDELNRQLGGILKVKVTKTVTKDGKTIAVTNPQFTPTWVDQKNYQIIPLLYAQDFGLKNEDQLYKQVTAHMKTWVPSLSMYRPTQKVISQ